MGYPVVINGVAATLENPPAETFIGQAGGFLAIWTDDPNRVIASSSGVGESATYTITAGDKTTPVFHPVGAPLPINTPYVWIVGADEYRTANPGGESSQLWAVRKLRIGRDGSVSLVGGVESDGSFWRGFAKGAVTWAAITYGAVSLGGMVGAGSAGVSPIAQAVGPSDWILATSGMGEGMGTANILASVAPAVPVAAVTPVSSTLPTLAQIGSGIQTAVQTVQQTAASIVGVAAAVNTVRAAVNTPDPVVPKADENASKTADNTLMYAGVGVLLLLALKG